MALLGLFSFPVFAQNKPPESTSKVKRVMLYKKIFGGMYHVEGQEEVRNAMASLASAKGFDIVEVANDSGITLDFLKQFQVIVWNNNSGGVVPSATARQAILDYLDQGGGWMLIHASADYDNTWPDPRTVLGTRFAFHMAIGQGEVVLDEDALAHKELKWMLEGIPRTLQFKDSWDTYYNTVRPLPGVTVIATARSIVGAVSQILPTPDGSGDQVYGWAREVGRGRLIFTPLGHGGTQLMAQQDSVIPRLYWENIRYAAGDFQNGCTRPQDSRFDPAARVHAESDCGEPVTTFRDPIGGRPGTAPGGFMVSRGGFRLRVEAPAGSLRVGLRDLQGALVWERNLTAGTGELALDGSVGAGIYQVEIRGAAGMVRRRLALP